VVRVGRGLDERIEDVPCFASTQLQKGGVAAKKGEKGATARRQRGMGKNLTWGGAGEMLHWRWEKKRVAFRIPSFVKRRGGGHGLRSQPRTALHRAASQGDTSRGTSSDRLGIS